MAITITNNKEREGEREEEEEEDEEKNQRINIDHLPFAVVITIRLFICYYHLLL